MTSAIVSALHVLALGIGLPSVFFRGRALKGPLDAEGLRRLFAADNAWGGAAVLWIGTGLLRAFGGLEKGAHFYLHSRLFWAKVALFATILALEAWPMVTFIRWRSARRSGRPLPQFDRLARLVLVDDLETGLVVVIPFVAAAMARGLWLY